MKDELKKFLTENILHECWHAFTFNDFGYKVCKCNGKPWIFGDSNERIDLHTNRTFDNRNDLMDLYQQVYEDGKWGSFSIFSLRKFRIDRESDYYNSWRFCLNGEGYEERCKAVAEFYGWNEQRDPVIDKNSGAYRDN